MTKHQWRYQTPRTPTTAPVSALTEHDHCWQRLVALHLPFHLAPDAVYSRLVSGLSDIESLFLGRQDDAALAAYYDECTRELDVIARAGRPAAAPRARTLPPSVRHVAALQVQFMEEVFKSFRLDRYANALDSRGWMNTFRRWGCSPTFTAQFDSMEEALSEDFVAFFYHHVRDCAERIELRPVPHPWDPPQPRPTTALPQTMLGVRGLTAEETSEAGIFLDSGIGEARSRRGSSARTPTQATGAPPSKEGEATHGPGPSSNGPAAGGNTPSSAESGPTSMPNE
jgi:hypothetical protein